MQGKCLLSDHMPSLMPEQVDRWLESSVEKTPHLPALQRGDG